MIERTAGITIAFLLGSVLPALPAGAAAVEGKSERPMARQMERLGRGVVAVRRQDGSVFVGWRLLGTDPEGIAFHLYRSCGGGEPMRLTERPLDRATHFVDNGVDFSRPNAWFVRPVLEGKELEPSAPFTLPADAPARPYISIPLRTLDGHTPNDASAGDLDGDGEYEIVLKQEMRGRDNSQAGPTGQTKLEAYRLDGTFLWRIDLGRNIREGAHYTQFLVYDLDGDGRAEVALKTADGAIDGKGKVIGDAGADHRDPRGYVLQGPEYLTVFDGQTGAALATADYIPPRGKVSDWGDAYGNRADRFLACIAYLDGERPSLVMCRGYYTRAVLAAWNWRGGKLSHLWTFDSDDGAPGNLDYRGQGNHGLSVADVDGDGRDEIIYGSCCIDDDGKGLYSTKLGHGDAMHVSDLDPDRPGLEVFAIHERPSHPNGISFRDARTGAVLWGAPSSDVGRGLAMDIDPRHRGAECWASGPGLEALYTAKGEKIPGSKPRSCNMGVWWDGDPLRELLDRTSIAKWDPGSGRAETLLDAADHGCASNNGTKANPSLAADILGDWREEVIWRSRDNRELRIFTTAIPTELRLYTLMHDPVYRLGIAWQNVAYNQPAHTGFYLGHGMAPPPRPAIRLASVGEPAGAREPAGASEPAASDRPAAQKGPYAAWKNGPGAGEDFFPIAVWLQAPGNAPRYKSIGINLYVGLWRGPTAEQLAELERHGMPVICSLNGYARENLDRKIIIGWMHGDEPDNAQSLGRDKGYGPPIAPEKIIADYQGIRAVDPTRPVLLNLGQGVAWDGWHGRGVRTNHPEDYPEYVKGCDIASFDIYPAVHDRPAVRGKLWYVPRGVERLRRWTEDRKPVWNCIETTRISNPDVKPTPGQVKAEVWMSIIHGSRGIIYFCHQFQPRFIEAGLLADDEMAAAVGEINRRIRELAPVLNSGTEDDGVAVDAEPVEVSPELTEALSPRPIALLARRHRGARYIFAVRMEDSPARATFTVEGLPEKTTVEVLGEARALEAGAGRFADDFPPHGVRLYRIR